MMAAGVDVGCFQPLDDVFLAVTVFLFRFASRPRPQFDTPGHGRRLRASARARELLQFVQQSAPPGRRVRLSHRDGSPEPCSVDHSRVFCLVPQSNDYLLIQVSFFSIPGVTRMRNHRRKKAGKAEGNNIYILGTILMLLAVGFHQQHRGFTVVRIKPPQASPGLPRGDPSQQHLSFHPAPPNLPARLRTTPWGPLRSWEGSSAVSCDRIINS